MSTIAYHNHSQHHHSLSARAKRIPVKQASVILLVIVSLINGSAISSPRQQCIRANPTVILGPTSQSGFTGQQLTYRVTVINNDSAACSPSVFAGMAEFPEAGFKHIPVCFRLTLSPGETGSRMIKIQAPGITCSGPKTFREVVVNESAPGFSGFASAVFDLTSLGPNCGLGTCLPVTPGHKPKQSLQDKLSRLVRNTQVPSALAAAIYQMARRFLLGFSAANSLEQAAFSVFQKLSPEVREVMACSVRAFDGLNPADQCHLFDMELTGLGDQPISPATLAQAVSKELLQRTSLAVYGHMNAISEVRVGQVRPRLMTGTKDITSINPVICRVNGVRTSNFVPPLTLSDFAANDELQQMCVLDSGSPPQLNCQILTANCPGNFLGDAFGINACLRVPEVNAGDAVTLQGFNFFNAEAKAHLVGPVTRDLDTHVVGDADTPLTETIGGVERIIADCRVQDILTFKVPSDLPTGVYSFQIIEPNNTGSGSPLLQSGVQFISVLPSVDTCFQIASEKLFANDETDAVFFAPKNSGEDEVQLKVLALPIGLDFTPGSIIETNFPRFDDVDSGETRELNRVLFKQSKIGGVSFSIIGFEVDSEDAFRKQIQDLSDAYVEVLKSSWGVIADAIGTVGGLTALALGLSAGWAAAIAAAITLAVDLIVAAWAPADLIIEDSDGLTFRDLATLTSPDFPPPPSRMFTSPGGIRVTVAKESKGVQYTERRRYISDDEGSNYEITLRYNRFSSCP